MTVQIQNIQITNLGPLDSLQETLGQVNLIYGRNETGKTYLVEFLLRSLFQHAKQWDLRDLTGRGSLQVQGLGPEPVLFAPERGPKIEDFWEEHDQGLPLNLARFLVVKGGELALAAESQGGVGRDVLKGALTSQALLDGIWNSIGATVREAKLEGSQIIGAKRSPLTTQADLDQEIQDLENLLAEIDDSYSRGPAWEIERKIEGVREELGLQQKAKFHLAYQANSLLINLEKQRESLSKKGLQELRDSLRDLETLERDIKTLQSKKKDAEARSQGYVWLESAQQIWEEKGLDQKGSPPAWLGIAGLSGIGLGLILFVLEQFIPVPEYLWLGGGLALAGLGLSLTYGILQRRWLKTLDDSQERKTIREEFQAKFQTELGGLADLKAQQARLAEFHNAAQATQGLLAEKANQRERDRLKLENLLVTLTGEKIPARKWSNKSAELQQRSQALDEEIVEAKLNLTKLAVPEEDHLAEPPPVDYDPELIIKLEKQLEEYQASLEDYRSDLDSLKGQAAGRLGVEVTRPWREVLYGLQELLRHKEAQFRELTAQIVAQIGLTEVLTRLREEEDQKINQAINTAAVSQLLFQITGKYHKLELVNDQLQVWEEHRSYPLAELSTGAREQVQLALRLGIASQLCGGDPLFLILDDAFQHSDWQRREALVSSTLGLAQAGWQILYLTMDDHIRDLFQKQVKPVLKSGYKMIDLN